MVKKRRNVKLKTVATALTTSVFVTIFIFSYREIADDKRPNDVTSQILDNLDIHKTQRSLLHFKHRRKRLQDTGWFTGPLKKSLKYLNTTDTETRDNILITVNNKNLKTSSETTPYATDAPTRPITTQSDTTPIFTDAPTQPITTESITTPIVTEPGENQITTEDPEHA